MNISPLQNQVAAADVPLEQLAGNRALSEEQKVAEASRQFESLLVHQILKETQKTVIKSSFTDNSTASEIYRDMISNQLAESISKSGDLGLARTLERQLSSQLRRTPSGGEGAENRPARPDSIFSSKRADMTVGASEFAHRS